MQARLSVVAGTAAPPFCNLLPSQEICLGRNRSNTIVLRDQHASRVHAVIYFQDKRWFLRDCDTTNGTRLNGHRIRETVPLEHGAQIGIGDVRLHFSLDPTVEVVTSPNLTPVEVVLPSLADAEDLHQTTLHADELSILVQFMNDSLKETSPQGLLRLALNVVRGQTMADLCGFLSLDLEFPLPRVVVPAEAEVDAHLSRQLTQQSVQRNRPIWLAASQQGEGDSDSLAAFSDAICIPLRATQEQPAARGPDIPLGALHVYKAQRAFTPQQFRFCEVLAGCLANSLRVLRARRALEADISRLRIRVPNSGDQLIGTSTGMQQVRQQISRLATALGSVLIVGESGVGKELVALALHHQSTRREGPLVPVNCAAIVATMPEAELFGHEEGAFTGATRSRPGHFQLADEGTLFLDEIGELSLECQAKLLRVIEGKPFRPVGADKPITVDVRVIAATNRDLQKELREGRFREDLYYRLGMSIKVPPLREHPEDIPALVEHFLTTLNAEYRRQVSLSEGALLRLTSYSWPGNVRQLRTVLETAVAMTEGDVIMPSDLHLPAETLPTSRPPSLDLQELEIWAIREALTQTEWQFGQAAKLLGMHRETLTLKVKKYKIERPK